MIDIILGMDKSGELSREGVRSVVVNYRGGTVGLRKEPTGVRGEPDVEDLDLEYLAKRIKRVTDLDGYFDDSGLYYVLVRAPSPELVARCAPAEHRWG